MSMLSAKRPLKHWRSAYFVFCLIAAALVVVLFYRIDGVWSWPKALITFAVFFGLNFLSTFLPTRGRPNL